MWHRLRTIALTVYHQFLYWNQFSIRGEYIFIPEELISAGDVKHGIRRIPLSKPKIADSKSVSA